MSAERVLVAFASRSGSTAVIADAIAAVLRDAGLGVEASPAGDVSDVTAYDAVVLGSGVFLPRRGSDGGGFLVRHGAVLKTRAVWLFCAGPIGRGRAENAGGLSGDADRAVAEVARAVGARGYAEFGTPVPEAGADPVAEMAPVDVERVRAWAREIAVELDPGAASPAPTVTAARTVRPQRREKATAAG